MAKPFQWTYKGKALAIWNSTLTSAPAY
jgi:hypothetical protein